MNKEDAEFFEQLERDRDFYTAALERIERMFATREKFAQAEEAAKVAKELPGLIAQRDSVVSETETKEREFLSLKGRYDNLETDFGAFLRRTGLR